MKNKYLPNVWCFAAILCVAFTTCDSTLGHDPLLDDDSYIVTEVIITPRVPNVLRGTTLQLYVEVKGVDRQTGLPVPPERVYQGVTWTVQGIEGQVKHASTTINNDGLLTIVAAEELSGLQVNAASVKDSEVTDFIWVRVFRDSSWMPTITSVTVDPAFDTVRKGTTVQFSSETHGANDPNQSVTWSIDGTTHSPSTTISSTGFLVISPEEILSSLTIRATSQVDISKSGTATLTLTPGEILLPRNVLRYFGSTEQLVYNTFPLDPYASDRTYEVTIEYKATGGSRMIGMTTSDGSRPVGFGNHGMPAVWFSEGAFSWDAGFDTEEYGNQQPNENNQTGHTHCNLRIFLPDTDGIWRTLRLSFNAWQYFWPWAASPLSLLIYMNPENYPDAEVMINYITVRRHESWEDTPLRFENHRIPTGDFEGDLTGWTGIEGNIAVESIPAPQVPSWFYSNYVGIQEQPAAGTMRLAGFTDPVQLSVNAVAYDGGTLSYQWHQSNRFDMVGSTSVGTNSGTLSVNESMLASGEFFHCVITSSVSGSTATTSVARVWTESEAMLNPNGTSFLQGNPLSDGLVSLGQKVTVVPGQTYVLGIRYRTGVNRVSLNAGPQRTPDWFLDVSDNLLPATNNAWSVFATMFTAPTEGPTNAGDLSEYYIFLINRSNGAASPFAVDEIWLYPVDSPQNILANGNFTSAPTGISVINSVNISAAGQWYTVSSWSMQTH